MTSSPHRVTHRPSRPKRAIDETLARHAPPVTLPRVLAQAVAAIALCLLTASGVSKLADPQPTVGALRSAGLPAATTLAVLLGGAEILAGIGSLLFGGLATVTAGLLYVGFAGFTLTALRNSNPIQSCGCFGREDTPPTRIHLVYNVVAAVSLIYAGLGGISPIEWGAGALELTGYIAFALIGAYASFLLLARLPRLANAIHTA